MTKERILELIKSECESDATAKELIELQDTDKSIYDMFGYSGTMYRDSLYYLLGKTVAEKSQ